MMGGKGRIRRALFAVLVFATIAFVSFGCSATATSHAPVITEVYYDTYLNWDIDEFIRIHNPTESSINIGGWQITDREGVIMFPDGANIDAGCGLYTSLITQLHSMKRCFRRRILNTVWIQILHQP